MTRTNLRSDRPVLPYRVRFAREEPPARVPRARTAAQLEELLRTREASPTNPDTIAFVRRHVLTLPAFELYHLAADPRCPSDILAALTTHTDATVRARALLNPASAPTPRALRGAARSRTPSLRAAAAQHPGTPRALLTRLVGDRHADVAAGAAANPSTRECDLLRAPLAAVPEDRLASVVVRYGPRGVPVHIVTQLMGALVGSGDLTVKDALETATTALT